MQQFNYTVKDKSGITRKGLVEAVDTKAASTILHDRGFVVIRIEPKKKAITFFGGVGIGPIANFTRQLATMISSGFKL